MATQTGTTILEKWACSGCGEFHDDVSAARECCEPIQWWVCSLCAEYFLDIALAKRHISKCLWAVEMELEREETN